MAYLYDYCEQVSCYVLNSNTQFSITDQSAYKLILSGNEIKEGNIRLVGGEYLWEGRLEIFIHGVWGTFSDDGAGTTDATVVCRQLGYNTYSKYSPFR